MIEVSWPSQQIKMSVYVCDVDISSCRCPKYQKESKGRWNLYWYLQRDLANSPPGPRKASEKGKPSARGGQQSTEVDRGQIRTVDSDGASTPS